MISRICACANIFTYGSYYQGVIFCSNVGFPRYRADYEYLMKILSYHPIAQEIDPSTEIHEYLRTRIGEKLAEAMVKDITGRITGGANVQFASFEAELSKAIQAIFRKPVTLINLIETYLQQITNPILPDEIKKLIKKSYSNLSPNLMIIISNASNFTQDKFEPTIKEVFSASVPQTKQCAGLTLVFPSAMDIHKLLHSNSWFEYNPEKIVSDSSGKIWPLLDEEVQKNFADQETFSKLLLVSKGETGLLREEWYRLWNLAKDRGENKLSYL
jgi:hypothetical protein